VGDYPWSSYLFYTSRRKKPSWLYPKEILNQMNVRAGAKERYKAFVESGVDEELKQFYGKGNIMPFLGSENFRAWAYSQKSTDEEAISEQEKYYYMDAIIQDVAQLLNVSIQSILQSERGKENIPRWVAMYLCQEVGDHRLIDIAHKFGLKRASSIPATIAKIKVLLKSDKVLKRKIGL